ncbi:hypothetical protein SCP_0406470 [Sparassis crispa]|uniref:Uncharacterized protein n=1 Tax=Sparassis crispa TaxID=139825 RepID=A0A401GJC3_9APHY|nr:hypothetical protein SCP_0406470 [Sparassis crispa]GBE82263.1 hypothetical protein SCP_0406470 [Sparassis crispa]
MRDPEQEMLTVPDGLADWTFNPAHFAQANNIEVFYLDAKCPQPVRSSQFEEHYFGGLSQTQMYPSNFGYWEGNHYEDWYIPLASLVGQARNLPPVPGNRVHPFYREGYAHIQFFPIDSQSAGPTSPPPSYFERPQIPSHAYPSLESSDSPSTPSNTLALYTAEGDSRMPQSCLNTTYDYDDDNDNDDDDQMSEDDDDDENMKTADGLVITNGITIDDSSEHNVRDGFDDIAPNQFL